MNLSIYDKGKLYFKKWHVICLRLIFFHVNDGYAFCYSQFRLMVAHFWFFLSFRQKHIFHFIFHSHTITDNIYWNGSYKKKTQKKQTPLLPPLKTMLEFTTKINWLKSSTLFIGGEGRGACCARKNVKFIEIDDRSNYFVRDCL